MFKDEKLERFGKQGKSLTIGEYVRFLCEVKEANNKRKRTRQKANTTTTASSSINHLARKI